MTELLLRDDGKAYCSTLPRHIYTYRSRNEFQSGLSADYQEYNKTMKKSIVFLKNGNGSYQEIDQYFRKVAKEFDRMEVDEKKLSGMPLVKNTRIPVSLILACMKDEMTLQEICREYGLEEEDIVAAMEYAIEILDTPYQEGLE